MTAYSPNGEKCDVTGMSINVAEATGDVMFWMNSCGYVIRVELDGMKKEINTYYPTYNPDCGDEGCATFNDLTVGDHYFYAESYDGYWSGTITIEKGVCKRMLLLKGKALPFKDGNMPEVDKRMAERIERLANKTILGIRKENDTCVILLLSFPFFLFISRKFRACLI